jgi:hypothetical protein
MRTKEMRKALPVLRVIANLPTDGDRSTLIRKIDDASLDALCECIHNGLYNHEKIAKDGIERLLPRLKADQRKLKYVGKATNSVVRRRKKAAQIGGSIGLILGVLIPALVSLLASKKKR